MKYNIGEYVMNPQTGRMGKVIGYGHEIVNNVYTLTLKVLVDEAANSSKRLSIMEDKISAWSLIS